jgi:hypothetical protein
MTEKEHIIPGRSVVVANRNNGGVYNNLVIMPSHGDGLGSFPATDGMILKILAKPKKDVNGINCVKIQYDDEKFGWAYYAHIRYCTFTL